jgi:hypothetical protein
MIEVATCKIPLNMIHVKYKYAVAVYIVLQLGLVSAFVFTDDFEPLGFMLSSIGITFTLLAFYFDNKHREKSINQ